MSEAARSISPDKVVEGDSFCGNQFAKRDHGTRDSQERNQQASGLPPSMTKRYEGHLKSTFLPTSDASLGTPMLVRSWSDTNTRGIHSFSGERSQTGTGRGNPSQRLCSTTSPVLQMGS
jgi:hypothetical protein